MRTLLEMTLHGAGIVPGIERASCRRDFWNADQSQVICGVEFSLGSAVAGMRRVFFSHINSPMIFCGDKKRLKPLVQISCSSRLQHMRVVAGPAQFYPAWSGSGRRHFSRDHGFGASSFTCREYFRLGVLGGGPETR